MPHCLQELSLAARTTGALRWRRFRQDESMKRQDEFRAWLEPLPGSRHPGMADHRVILQQPDLVSA